MADTIEAKKGIVLRDKITGEPYCVVIKNGELQHILGECGTTAVPQPQISHSQTPVSPAPIPDTSTSTPDTTTTTTPDQESMVDASMDSAVEAPTEPSAETQMETEPVSIELQPDPEPILPAEGINTATTTISD